MVDRNSNVDEKDLSFGNLAIISRLGRGSTSHVFKTQSIRTKKYYAMKVIDKCKSNYELPSLIKEISIHKMLRHPHISRFVRHFEDEQNHYMVTEYCNNGEITKLLLKPVSQKSIIKVVRHIGSALDYMHNQVGVAHGDLKLSNILINESDYKLCDFGFSVLLKDKIQREKSIFGTLLYMSPQILRNDHELCFKKSDIWAIGICLMTLMLQGNPYQTESPSLLKKKIMNSEYVELTKDRFPNYSHRILQLVSRMLQKDPKKRINVEEVLKWPSISKETDQSLPNQGPTDEETQKQDINKSLFNSTMDSLADLEEIKAENTSVWSYCLKPQKHQTANNGFIQILEDLTVQIKVEKIQYSLSANGNRLQVTKGPKGPKVYFYDEIVKNEKLKYLYDYGCELVSILKKKQCLKQQVVGGKYFWVTKTSICCLFNEKCILEKNRASNQIFEIKLGPQSMKTPLAGSELTKVLYFFQKGEAELFKSN